MQVFLALCEAYYPRHNLKDIVGTLSKIPDSETIAACVKAFGGPDQEIGTVTADRIDWAVAFVVDGSPQVVRHVWSVGHNIDPKQLKKQGFIHIWHDEDDDSLWHGIRAEAEVRTEQLPMLA